MPGSRCTVASEVSLMKLHIRALLTFTWILLIALPAAAAITGQCADCHTMHNSQGGEAMFSNGGPHAGLLKNDCVGCHTGINTGSGTPFVLTVSSVDYKNTGTESGHNTLAGGNFYWVENGTDSTGHDVTTLSNVTSASEPPGYTGGTFGTTLTCAGSTGCHGDRTKSSEYEAISGYHHNNASGAVTDGYRFLDGIAGYEDTNWEFTVSNTDHNQHKGVDKHNSTDDSTPANYATTISYLCGICHGDFHNSSSEISTGNNMQSAWLRHPTDYDMYNVRTKDDYAGYGTAGINNYDIVAPVASTNISSVISTGVYSASGKAIITCISCHRAHGTPYQSIVRWDYKLWPGGTNTDGCQKCHTAKD